MNWLKLKLRRWVNSAQDSYPVVEPVSISRGANSIEVEGLGFSVMPARGGTVVQIRQYDRKTDRNNYITHVIPDGDNIAERIGQIVSLELLRV
jgi:hypothetical protein